MAKPKVAICARKCKGKKRGAFRACVRKCTKGGGRRKKRRR